MNDNRQATTFTRIAVLNRGEPAVRFLRALREYNLERGLALEGIAFYTDPDAGAPFVRMADEAIHLGAAMVPGPDGALVSAYCNGAEVVRQLQEANCDAVWPGWGFASEDTTFVARLEEVGIVFIGPSSEAMERLGDKIESKKLAEQCNVPMAPWHLIDMNDDEATLIAAAERIGFPLMVKASAGGGGRGIRRVDAADGLLTAIKSARDEVRKVFGQGGLFMESCLTGARHVEVQLACGADGKAFALGVRDCSIQRRNQKILEEAPSPVLPPAQVEALCSSSVKLAELAGYQGVGTAEFLYDPSNDRCCFLEVNSRLQVEHTITEALTGCDLVHIQLDIALGNPLDIPEGHGHGCAIEVRLNAENAERGFQPSPGKVRVFRAPAGPGIRVDSGVVEGMDIAPEFDSMIAKVIAWAPTRHRAIARMKRALQELSVVVEDGATNKAFLLDVLDTEEFVSGGADTGWLDRAMKDGRFNTPAWEYEALVTAAIVEYQLNRHAEIQRFFAQTQNGIPQNLPRPESATVELGLRGRACSMTVSALGADRYLVGTQEIQHEVVVEPTGAHSATLHLEGRRHQVLYSYGRTGIAVEVDGAMHPVERASGGVVRAHAPAMVVHVSVEEGQTIETGDTLCVLEAMKMEMAVFSQESGVVKAVLIQPNQQVVAGQSLVILEPENRGEAVSEGDDLIIPEASTRPMDALFDAEGSPALQQLDTLGHDATKAAIDDLCDALRSLLLGFDTNATLVSRVERLLNEHIDLTSVAAPQQWASIVGLLSTFADVEALFERRLLPANTAGTALSIEQAFYDFCRQHHEGEDGAHEAIRPLLRGALRAYGVHSLDSSDVLRTALWRMAVAHAHSDLRHRLVSSLLRASMALHRAGVVFASEDTLRETFDRVAQLSSDRHPFVSDNARQATYVLFDQSRYVARRQVVAEMLGKVLQALTGFAPDSDEARAWMDELSSSPHSIFPLLLHRVDPMARETPYVAEAIIRRLYAGHSCRLGQVQLTAHTIAASFKIESPENALNVLGILGSVEDIPSALDAAKDFIADPTADTPDVVEITLQGAHDGEAVTKAIERAASQAKLGADQLQRVTFSWSNGHEGLRHRTFTNLQGALVENVQLREIHPEAARRLAIWRLGEFDLDRLDSPEQIHAFRGKARTNVNDERIFVFAEVRNIPARPSEPGAVQYMWEFEQVFFESLRILRQAQAQRAARRRLHWNLLTIYVRPVIELTTHNMMEIARQFEGPTHGLGLQKAVIHARVKLSEDAPPRPMEFVFTNHSKHRTEMVVREPTLEPVRAVTPYEMRVVRSRRMGFFYPYEIARMLEGKSIEGFSPSPALPSGRFVEYDLDDSGERLIPVSRAYGNNTCGMVVGLVTSYTDKYREGVERVWVASDPTHSMCALAEPECRRVLAAMDLAEERGVPVEWLPISAGARIAMDSGTENLDWTARVLRRLVEFTQAGGEINVIVSGVNVGAQSYWNAEATMLMHTRGVLIMTPAGSMVLTGKKALEYSGGVAAEDERGIGGFERIMGPNGQAQYYAADLSEAYAILFDHYNFTWTRPGESTPRAMLTGDPADRSILGHAYAGEGFATIGEIFDDATNPERKKPFEIREVMGAVIDQDGGHLERFKTMHDAETAVIWDAHLGGIPVCLLGIESRPLTRHGRIPMDGPDTWTGGTLFPQSSKKVARAINTASGNRPVVVLANLSGFDGSPESLRRLQLEYGAEIGRAVVNFDGPIIFVVISRYHGGAYVVFSKALNPNLTALALEGTFASVIGGGPAAAVVFPRVVRRRAEQDPRVKDAKQALADAPAARKPILRERLDALTSEITFEKQGEVAREFNAIHTVERAVEVGSLDAVIAPARLRPAIIERLEAAQTRAEAKLTNGHNGAHGTPRPVWAQEIPESPEKHLN